MTNPTPHGQVPEALETPSPDQLRAIARVARNSSGSASDDCGPLAYVLHGWRAAAIAFRAQQAALVKAQQPAPSAAAAEIEALRALSVTNIMLDIVPGLDGMGHEVYAKSVKDVEDKLSAMGQELEDWQLGIRLYQPSLTPQADSQPVPVEVADAMADSQYLAGVSAGWNAANADDPNAALQKLHESRAGYLKPLSAARAPADSVTAPAGGEIDRLRAALVYVAFALHGTPQHMLAEGITLIDGDTVRVSRDGWTVEASINPARATPPAQAADSVLEDSARLDWLDQQCEAYGFQDIHEGNRWEISGSFANVRKAIDAEMAAARKQGGAT